MKADYKNWMPKGMILGALAVAVVFCIATVIIGVASVVGKVVLVLTILCTIMTLWMIFDVQSFFLQWHETDVKTDYRRCGFICENS